MKVMDKPDVQRMVTRFRREPNNYLLGKKLRTIIWREKTKQNPAYYVLLSKNMEKACERGIRYSVTMTKQIVMGKCISVHLSSNGGLIAKSCPTLVTPWTVDCKAPLSMGFSRQEYME